MIPFNRPSTSPRELGYVTECLASGKLSGDGRFTKESQLFFERRYGFAKALLTTSCTDALEMCALLLEIQPGDEVILPSFTFVSSANAFALRGAKLVFADSEAAHPNISAAEIERLITPRTKAIVVVHYAGVACDMDRICAAASAYGIPVVEDAAQAVDSTYRGRPLGSIGRVAAFSFHETKNINCGEGGLFVANDPSLAQRAEIIREKGTNRSAFFRGEVDKYGWVDVGSSFLPSDILASYLLGQLERLDEIQSRRREVWRSYSEGLAADLQVHGIEMPQIPEWASNNAHMFYLVCSSLEQRSRILAGLKERGVMATFHYLSLHASPYFAAQHDGRPLPNSDRFTNCLLRLPLFAEMTDDQVSYVIETLLKCVRH